MNSPAWQQQTIALQTSGRGFYDLSVELRRVVRESGFQTGLCHCFLQHTSASLIITENADPAVRRDLEQYFQQQVVDGDPGFHHAAEGPDDMPAHIRAMWTGSGHTIPISDGQPALGTWQGLYLWEHRYQAHQRRVIITLNGE